LEERLKAPTARPRILIDTREQAPLRFSSAVDVERVTLETGDYSLAGHTAEVRIERKSVPDFVACVGPERERFLEQMKRLAGYGVRALVIEGSWAQLSSGSYRSNTRPQSVTGTLLALVTDLGLPILLAEDARGAAECVERMLIRVHKKALAA
jgi:DNA excision repair protein ERCC-4